MFWTGILNGRAAKETKVLNSILFEKEMTVTLEDCGIECDKGAAVHNRTGSSHEEL